MVFFAHLLGLLAASAWGAPGPAPWGAPPESSSASELERSRDTEPLAAALLLPRSGSSVRGELRLEEVDGGDDQPTVLVATLRLTEAPAGTVSVAIHSGDCRAADASSAGEVLAPVEREPGEPLGDIGLVAVGSDGRGALRVRLTYRSDDRGDVASFVLGKAVVVTAPADGRRLACGVLRPTGRLAH